MKTDILFYKIFEILPEMALHLAGMADNRDAEYSFQSVELKQQSQRPDGVLLPKRITAPVLVVEVQFQRDDQLYTRLVSETALLQMQYPERKAWQMLLVLPSRAIDVDAGIWDALIKAESLRVVYLNEFPLTAPQGNPVLRMVTPSLSPEVLAAIALMRITLSPADQARDMAIVKELRDAISETEVQRTKQIFEDLFIDLFRSKYKHLSIKELLAMIKHSDIFDDLHESLSVQELLAQAVEKAVAEAREKGKTEGKIEGKAEGKVEGKTEGKTEGKLETIPIFLQIGLSVEQIAEMLNLPFALVEEASKKANLPKQ
jgi:predicted transposase/invertase (TIGR01784 family)